METSDKVSLGDKCRMTAIRNREGLPSVRLQCVGGHVQTFGTIYFLALLHLLKRLSKRTLVIRCNRS